jgi:SAM-dependent methyltransferase
MASVKEHYDYLLARYYSWISGGLARQVEENRGFFRAHHIRPTASASAVDLGAGSGFQSIPLAEAGFQVLAIDLNRDLLAELERNAAGLSIRTLHDDLLNFTSHSPDQYEVIVCMGDTLTHLQRPEDVRNMLTKAYHALAEQGRLILTFRDMSRELAELDRFIPVRSEAGRIFTCFLEYEENHVKVHDILYDRIDEQWRMKKSFFRKLRISPPWVRTLLEEIGFCIETYGIEKGLVTLIARRS